MRRDDRRRRIDEICDAALNHAAIDRDEFISSQCGSDEELRREVQALLAHAPTAERFLANGVDAVAAGVLAGDWVGRRFASYEIVSRLGAGGMGEVYRARDTKLRRDVAIKVLPLAFTTDHDRLTRLRREARLLASLNHPYIAAIYGIEEVDGMSALVLELVEGETLADRLARGALSLADARTLAFKIADALEAAHDQGIVHRDLKPANIKITPAGMVKLLDFGLAKVTNESGSGRSDSPTMTRGGTRDGVLLGTASYMSPEQARGQAVDNRTDIWAFGCVVYEMLTGHLAFPGNTISDCIAAILEREPNWTALPVATPMSAHRLLRRCLDKDPNRRLHHIADARLELQDTEMDDTDRGQRIVVAHGFWSAHALMWIASLITVAAAILGLTSWIRSGTPEIAPASVFRFFLSEHPPEVSRDLLPSFAISPDGRRVVYAAIGEGVQRLYLRDMRTLEAKPILGTERGTGPFFSPEGQRLGFWADDALKVVSLDGGSPLTLVHGVRDRGATWAPDDTIIYSPLTPDGLWRVPVSGGTPQIVATPDSKKHERSYRWPHMLPGGDAILFTIAASDIVSFDDARIAVRSLKTGKQREVLRGGSFPSYVAPGYLLYARAGALQAVRFNAARIAVEGTATTVMDGITTYLATGAAEYAISSDGTLVYQHGTADLGPSGRLTWVDRAGRSTTLPVPPAPYLQPSISPDGRFAAFDIDGANDSIWILEFARNTMTRLTLEWNNSSSFWSPDGTRIAFNSERAGVRSLFWQPSEGHAEMEPLTPGRFAGQGSFSPDGQTLAFAGPSPDTGSDVWLMPMDGNHQARPFVHTKFDEDEPRFSPNGRWLAYVSNETGRPEVYVQAFPGPGRRVRISTDGGTTPIWSRDGREIFYRQASKLMAANVGASAADLSPQKPEVLFTKATGVGYDVAPDGRFLMIGPVEPTASSGPIAVVLNWTEELKARMPVK